MISVVIPAYNEASLIGELLSTLEPGVKSGELEVIVVANGCEDETAEIAGARGVAVIELSRGSKPTALRAGDGVASHFPRFYLDADVSIGPDALLSMSRSLVNEVLAVAPRLDLDATRASWSVRSYHRIWAALPSVQHSLAGRGCFGLSEVGRSRWVDWPDVTADDQFVNQQFDDDEKLIAADTGSLVRMPSGLGDLISRKRRSHRGNVELEHLGSQNVTSSFGWLRVIRSDPRRLVDMPVYLLVTLTVRFLAALDRRRGLTAWHSDGSSRDR